jgi:hypothetical protein
VTWGPRRGGAGSKVPLRQNELHTSALQTRTQLLGMEMRLMRTYITVTVLSLSTALANGQPQDTVTDLGL